MKLKHYLVVLVAILCLPAFHAAANENIDQLSALADGDHRSDAYKARNQYRHPAQTLDWFGIRNDMTVVEISPGAGGWYSEILAPYLRDNGNFYVGSYDSESEVEYYRRSYQKYADKLAAEPEIYGKVSMFEFAPPNKPDLQPEGQADMVLTFRNVHNWLNNDTADQIFAAIYKVLKPGGTLGLVTHRGEEHMVGKEWSKQGYVPEAEVIRLAQQAGLQFVDKAEINANPKDTKDHPKGVWTLPPAYRLKDEDREKYAAIGESDRMTMKFVKPE